MRRSLTIQVLLGLVAGLALGTAASFSSNSLWTRIARSLEPVGTLWVNAILMTVLPLIVSGLVVAVVAAARTGLMGRLGGRAIGLFLLLLVLATAGAAFAVPPLADKLPVSVEVEARFQASLAGAAATPIPKTSVGDWVANLLPSNVFKAAADGAILALVLFTIFFATAVSRIADRPREMLVGFFRGVSEAMTVLLSGIVRLAPIAVFVLSFALAARVGLSATEALGVYVLVLSGLCIALTLGLYLLPWVLARVSPVRFARAAAPAQLVAFAAHSSLASLPAMLDGAERILEVPKPVSRFTLPLAVSILKVSGPVHCLTAAYFVARLTGHTIPSSELLSLSLLSLVLSFSLPGVPHGAILVTAPVLAAAGLPTQAVALLLAVDSIPNAFRSAANSTGNMVVAAILGRSGAAQIEAASDSMPATV